jgi:hypothetical protein
VKRRRAVPAVARDFRGSRIVTGIDRERESRRLARCRRRPSVAVDAQRPAPRLALLHSWLNTQTEGWWRQRLDLLGAPYDYISTQDVAASPDLAAKYDVILFPPVGAGEPQRIVTGLPMWGGLALKTTTETPNLGTIDATEDQRQARRRPRTLAAVRRGGGLLVAVATPRICSWRLHPGVRVTEIGDAVVGSIPTPASRRGHNRQRHPRSPRVSAIASRSTAPRG